MKYPRSYVRVAVAAFAMAASFPLFAADTTSTTCPAQININKADVAQLDQCLDHVGPKTAEAIVAYRTANGNFKDVKDIAEVKGISKTLADKLAPKLTVK